MKMSSRITHVYGPAYLDRVIRVDRPIHGEGKAALDQSVDGSWTFGEGLALTDPAGTALDIDLPQDWPGPCGVVRLSYLLRRAEGGTIYVKGLSWHDDLGGMGAGYASALDGVLVSALGSESDPMSLAVEAHLQALKIWHRPIRIPDHPADWTLLVTSGPFGDKLPVGFRGCHASLQSLMDLGPCNLKVVASFPNRVVSEALRQPGARVRFFAPAMRNMMDRDCPLERFAEFVDILSCNRHEWESLEGREQVAWQVSLLAVTDGPRGSLIRYTTPDGEAGRLEMPAFPRNHPPLDTNRAGEAFGSALVETLLEAGWNPSGGTDPDLVRLAAVRASAAAALILDHPDFGFPSSQEVDRAVEVGVVESSTRDSDETLR